MADDSVSRKSNVVYTLFGPKTPLKRGATGQGLQTCSWHDRSQNFVRFASANCAWTISTLIRDINLGFRLIAGNGTAANARKRYRSPKKKRSEAMRHKLATYGIDEITYETMVAEQDGKCAICVMPWIWAS